MCLCLLFVSFIILVVMNLWTCTCMCNKCVFVPLFFFGLYVYGYLFSLIIFCVYTYLCVYDHSLWSMFWGEKNVVRKKNEKKQESKEVSLGVCVSVCVCVCVNVCVFSCIYAHLYVFVWIYRKGVLFNAIRYYAVC